MRKSTARINHVLVNLNERELAALDFVIEKAQLGTKRSEYLRNLMMNEFIRVKAKAPTISIHQLGVDTLEIDGVRFTKDEQLTSLDHKIGR